MLVNSSSSSNSSLPPSSFPSSFSFHYLLLRCLNTKASTFNVTAYTITIILLLLPLCILVLHLGLQRWRQQRTTMKHSDLFTYHMVFMELINVFGFSLSCCGVYAKISQMISVGIFAFSVNVTGLMFFHILTCVERYLAVVHPITYLSLRTAKGIRIRNITIGCVWLICFAASGLTWVKDKFSITIIYFFDMCIAITAVSFCSLSVLCVLIRPGPGDGGGDRQRVDKSKLRAFYTIMVILGVLLFRFGGNMLALALVNLTLFEETESCVMWLVVPWSALPSSLALPLLFLQRAGKLACCKSNKTLTRPEEEQI